MQVFVMSLIGMILVVCSTIWAYWTGVGGVLMMGVGVFFILIAKDLEDEKYDKAEKIRIMKYTRQQKIKELREAATKEAALREAETAMSGVGHPPHVTEPINTEIKTHTWTGSDVDLGDEMPPKPYVKRPPEETT